MDVIVARALLDMLHRLPEARAAQLRELLLPQKLDALADLRIDRSILLVADVLCKRLLIFLECFAHALPHIVIEASDGIGDAIAIVRFIVFSQQPLHFLNGGGVVAVVILAALVAHQDRQTALLLIAEEVGSFVVSLAHIRDVQDAGTLTER